MMELKVNFKRTHKILIFEVKKYTPKCCISQVRNHEEIRKYFWLNDSENINTKMHMVHLK